MIKHPIRSWLIDDGQAVMSLPNIGRHRVAIMSWSGLFQCLLLLLSYTLTADAAPLAETDNKLEEVVIVGSRAGQRSQYDEAVAVDVYAMHDILAQSGHSDLNALLHTLLPSFNANRQHGADGADHIDPASLRGLGPDELLVLINGKRRHTSSLVNIFGYAGKGNVGTDLNAIPVSAIDRIEVLRDGASAQYGSDAIAGVINIILKSEKGTQASVRVGQYATDYDSPAGHFSPQDGLHKQLLLSHTAEIADSGFWNLSMDYQTREQTDRTYGIGVEPLRTIGSSAVDQLGLFSNFSMPIGDSGTEVYAFGGMSQRQGLASAFTRPADSVRNITAVYPDGFVPSVESKINDESFALGLKQQWMAWQIDISSSYGKNRFEYGVSNSLNASLGTASANKFDAGGFELAQNTVNLDLFRAFDYRENLGLAWGLEYRTESYGIFSGDKSSYQLGTEPPLNGVARPAGSQGFPGFRPENEIDAERDSTAAYVDVELDWNADLLLGAALRAQKYPQWSPVVIGKLVSRWQVTQVLSLRAGYHTGFRAPSLPQVYFSSILTDVVYDSDTDTSIIQEEMLAANNSELAQLLGVPALKPEHSDSVSAGAVMQFNKQFVVTLDLYRIDVEDRILLTKGVSQANLSAQGLDEALAIMQSKGLSAVQFFVNAAETSTKGLEITASYQQNLGQGLLSTSLGYNHNDTQIVGEPDTPAAFKGLENRFLARRERLFIEYAAPKDKAILSLNYAQQALQLGIKFNYYGRVHHAATSSAPEDDQFYSPQLTTDIQLSYKFTPHIVYSAGVMNVTDEYPTEQDPNLVSGALWRSVQMGINGRSMYMSLALDY